MKNIILLLIWVPTFDGNVKSFKTSLCRISEIYILKIIFNYVPTLVSWSKYISKYVTYHKLQHSYFLKQVLKINIFCDKYFQCFFLNISILNTYVLLEKVTASNLEAKLLIYTFTYFFNTLVQVQWSYWDPCLV